MRLVIPVLAIHLAEAIAGVLAAAMASTFPGRAKWVVVVITKVVQQILGRTHEGVACRPGGGGRAA